MKAEIYNYKAWVNITSPIEIKTIMERLMANAGFRVLKRVSHRFHPVGYTAVWLLAESHLAVHSFPDSGKTYVELSSCNQVKTDAFVRLMKKENLVVQLPLEG